MPAPTLNAVAVRAGDDVVITWPSLATSAEELELVFSLDDGRRFDIRVSPELSGGQSRYVWRVPNVGVRRARLELRARIGGRELSGPETKSFAIIPNPLTTQGLWIYRNGEWWEDRGGVPFDLPGLVTPPTVPSLRTDVATDSVAVAARAPELAQPPLTSEPAHVDIAGTHSISKPSSRARQTFRSTRE